MNCFETRNEFAALWRKTATPDRRAELLEHLRGCDKCDHAFRLFALTAPVLHSDDVPAAPASGSACREYPFDSPARRVVPIARRTAVAPRWMAVAAAALLMLSGTAAYLSARMPAESLSDALSSGDTDLNNNSANQGDLFGPDQPAKVDDFAS
ncbi:MAG TPA: hypothetical protein VMU16_09620 [Candidatus Binataceae bacterium]|nr:hypothetical protein [Candidatus Binataceae bacterium]